VKTPERFADVIGLNAPQLFKPIKHGNRHEWVCGLTTSERSDWRRLAYPEMAVKRGS